MIPILLDIFYLLAALALSPLLFYRVWIRGKYKDTLAARLGRISHLPKPSQCIWLHGVSVGEIKAARPLVDRLKVGFPDSDIIISATSAAGKKMAAALYPDCRIISFPLDLSWTIRAYLHHFRPRLIVLMELEIWPNFLWHARHTKIPVVLVNGRLSAKSFRGYRYYLCGLFPCLTKGIRHYAMQSEIYAERLRSLGIPAEKISVTGNMKFDAIAPPKWLAKQAAIEKLLGLEPHLEVLLAGSTHAPEEKNLLACYCQLREEFPHLRLILVPRHPERSDEVAEWVRESKLLPVKKSEIVARYTMAGNHVVIGDRMGELAELYTVCHIAFVGGSLIPHGGQNFIEPASLGKAVVCGPHMHNFPEVELFLEQQAIVQLATAAALYPTIRELLGNAVQRKTLGEHAQELVARSQGSAERNYNLCLASL
jgi:3-deoxy-D-manno-octulosonic-acid transferase